MLINIFQRAYDKDKYQVSFVDLSGQLPEVHHWFMANLALRDHGPPEPFTSVSPQGHRRHIERSPVVPPMLPLFLSDVSCLLHARASAGVCSTFSRKPASPAF